MFKNDLNMCVCVCVIVFDKMWHPCELFWVLVAMKSFPQRLGDGGLPQIEPRQGAQKRRETRNGHRMSRAMSFSTGRTVVRSLAGAACLGRLRAATALCCAPPPSVPVREAQRLDVSARAATKAISRSSPSFASGIRSVGTSLLRELLLHGARFALHDRHVLPGPHPVSRAGFRCRRELSGMSVSAETLAFCLHTGSRSRDPRNRLRSQSLRLETKHRPSRNAALAADVGWSRAR